MKTKKASPASAEGTHSGRKLSSQPRSRNRIYCGMRVTTLGKSRMAMTEPNRIFFSGKSKRANGIGRHRAGDRRSDDLRQDDQEGIPEEPAEGIGRRGLPAA